MANKKVVIDHSSFLLQEVEKAGGAAAFAKNKYLETLEDIIFSEDAGYSEIAEGIEQILRDPMARAHGLTIPRAVVIKSCEEEPRVLITFSYDEKKNIIIAETHDEFAKEDPYWLEKQFDITGIKVMEKNTYPEEYTIIWHVYLVE